MAEDKKERRKQQLNKSTDQCLESTIEVETGMSIRSQKSGPFYRK